MTACPISIEISVEEAEWESALPAYEKRIENVLSQAVNHLKDKINTSFQDADISILLSNNDHIKTLNRDYRQKDKPTNVLSFPMEGEFAHGSLGDLALGLEIIAEEAREQNKSLADHFSHLIVHGFLHLLGYDHIDDTEAEEMEALEIQILGDMGIKNPYEAD